MKKLKFIDLFAGLGGFHIALSRLGHKCVYACEINPKLNYIYKKNFKIAPDYDIAKVNINQIPKHDVLCAGFPCQPFSKAGVQNGFDHKIAGDMFFHILNIVKIHKPKYLFLENVQNLKNHKKGKTWNVMKSKLEKNYIVEERCISPLHFNIPQVRFRMYILAIRKNKNIRGKKINWPILDVPKMTIIRKTNLSKYFIRNPSNPRLLTKEKKYILRMWKDFLRRIPKKKNLKPDNVKLYSPLWISEFGATYPYKKTTPFKIGATRLKKYKGTLGVNLKNKPTNKVFEFIPPYACYSRSKNEPKRESMKFPDWKIKFIENNRKFYKDNKSWINPWLKKYKKPKFMMAKEPTHRKFEWNCANEKYTLNDKIISFRGSGLRVKRMDAAPTLVHAVTSQVPYVPKLKRYLSIEECCRIQGLKKIIPSIKNESFETAYKALGNAVNADVVEKIAKSFLS